MVNKIFFNNLKINQSYTDSVKVTNTIIKKFASASGDKNPIHLNDKFAKNSIFGTRIAHGMLIASFISSVIGNKFPGNGTIYVSQNLEFKRPVKINDLVKIRIVVKKKILKKKWCELQTLCFVKNKIVLDGTAVVIPPQK
ncbi:MAG: (R)-specific enoyl-CoA hydratase [Alphaproteobacteria bacterium MarineAlpha6_Bin3]|nr:MAG: (R)-specific enoyl-CoA hydratase [Alphaproteobacteria bacterium MarineAlpha6_Bin3]|tara:strand:+ start:86 stop:505 length:420 start_codon:yes stop_codon:yes gene_type:complete